jgi:hypothetical protein
MSKEWLWVDPSTAAALAAKGDPTAEVLRKGHGFLGPEQFVSLLGASELRIIIFKNRTAALVTCGPCAEGVVLNILTVQGDIHSCEDSIKYLEQAAREAGADLIVSVGHPGWARVMKRQGYDIHPRLLMRKVLNDKGTKGSAGNRDSGGSAEELHANRVR